MIGKILDDIHVRRDDIQYLCRTFLVAPASLDHVKPVPGRHAVVIVASRIEAILVGTKRIFPVLLEVVGKA